VTVTRMEDASFRSIANKLTCLLKIWVHPDMAQIVAPGVVAHIEDTLNEKWSIHKGNWMGSVNKLAPLMYPTEAQYYLSQQVLICEVDMLFTSNYNDSGIIDWTSDVNEVFGARWLHYVNINFDSDVASNRFDWSFASYEKYLETTNISPMGPDEFLLSSIKWHPLPSNFIVQPWKHDIHDASVVHYLGDKPWGNIHWTDHRHWINFAEHALRELVTLIDIAPYEFGPFQISTNTLLKRPVQYMKLYNAVVSETMQNFVIIYGSPCTGKTTMLRKLVAQLRVRNLSHVVVYDTDESKYIHTKHHQVDSLYHIKSLLNGSQDVVVFTNLHQIVSELLLYKPEINTKAFMLRPSYENFVSAVLKNKLLSTADASVRMRWYRDMFDVAQWDYTVIDPYNGAEVQDVFDVVVDNTRAEDNHVSH
jgi:hypothetical protein